MKTRIFLLRGAGCLSRGVPLTSPLKSLTHVNQIQKYYFCRIGDSIKIENFLRNLEPAELSESSLIKPFKSSDHLDEALSHASSVDEVMDLVHEEMSAGETLQIIMKLG